MRLIIPILAPAIWSALAIGFAESISDFGVAATLAYNSNFSLATYQLYAAIGNFPPSFPLAAAMAWLLVAAVAIPLALQARALRGRSYAVLVRPDPAGGPPRSSAAGGTVAAAAGRGAVLRDRPRRAGLRRGERARCSATTAARSASRWSNYHALFAPAQPGRAAASCSLRATARIDRDHHRDRRVHRRPAADPTPDQGRPARSTSCCSPPWRCPAWSSARATSSPTTCRSCPRLGINLYQTVTLLVIAYTASSLPTNARVLVGAVSQLQPSLKDAARDARRGRAHRLGRAGAARWCPGRSSWPGCSPSAACSSSCRCPSCSTRPARRPPRSRSRTTCPTTTSVSAWPSRSLAVGHRAGRGRGVVLGGYRLLGAGRWRRIGGTQPVAEPDHASTRLGEDLPGRQPGAARRVAGRSSPARSWSCSARPARARRRCCAAWPGSSGSPPAGSPSARAPSPTGAPHVPPDRRDLSMVFQDYALWPHLTARDNVAFALRRRRLSRRAVPEPGRTPCSSGSASARSPAGTRTSCPAASSSGSRWPARWSPTPASILCDEPLSNLDADLRERMRVEISAAGPRGGRDHRVHHPRPGRGVRPRRPGRRARTRAARAGWHPGGDLHPPGHPVRRPFHRPVRRVRRPGPGHRARRSRRGASPAGPEAARPFRARRAAGRWWRVPGC